MSETFTYDVFISHSSKDKPFVRELAQRLKRDGLRVWFDEWEIKPGDMIDLKIKEGLEQSRTLILVMSANASRSEWTMLESHTALFRDPTNAQRRFIPLRLDDAPIKDILKQFTYIDWRRKSDNEYAKLLSACRAKILKGHKGGVNSVAVTSDGRLAVSGSLDKTVKVWDLTTGKGIATLEGHTDAVVGVAMTTDGRLAISGSSDRTIRVWDLTSGKCISILEGHTEPVSGVAVSSDGKLAVSGSFDRTVKVWDLTSGKCSATLEGHTDPVNGVIVILDGQHIISGSADRTVRVWDLTSAKCVAILGGHTDPVYGVAVTLDGRFAVSGSADRTVRLWVLPSSYEEIESETEIIRYSNAKVVLIGDSGVGKTGLALRLCENRWEPTESTHGVLVSHLKLPSSGPSDIEREVWLWDFAGQPDYRLIHQLYMDETALGILVFDPQDDNPFEDLGHWEKALNAATKYKPAKLLIAARCDRGGITVSKKRFGQFCEEHGFAGFLSTAAKTGEGFEELKSAISKSIPWDRLPCISTTRLFKTLKDAILKLKDESAPLLRLTELNQRLQLMLPGETFSETELRTVVGLMQGLGVVQMLNFGDFVLLQPEHINRYASVVVRMARENVDEMGIIPEHQVLEGRLDYKDMKRLSEADEKILLRAMVQMFLDRSLCIREQTPKGTLLVFPSYFRRDKPDLPEHPNVFVTYGFAGPLDEIYSTLVVKLSYSDDFRNDELWKNAADFKTHEGKRVGLVMKKKAEGKAEILVYFEAGVPDDTKVTFIKYVHEHLLARAQDVTRVRTYLCPHCDTPIEERKAIQIRLQKGLKDILCTTCEKRVPLLDLIEDKFASDEFMLRVREMDELAKIKLDNESRELILFGHAFAIAGEAGQIFRPYADSDYGIDGEIEFKDSNGNASGKRIYLQFKSGDYYQYRRRKDGTEVFSIKNPRHAEYWQQQAYPVMLVIRTFDGSIQWMDISAYLREQRRGRKSSIKQIIFHGEPLTAYNLQRMRDQLISPTSRNLSELAKAEREAEEGNEHAQIGMQRLVEGMLDISMAEFEQSLSKDPTNRDALEGLLTIASLRAESSFDQMDLILAILSKVSPAWLADRLCENIKLLDISMGQLLKLRLSMEVLPVTSIAVERNGFGWEVQLTSISANEIERKVRTLRIKIKRVDQSCIEIVADTDDLPWGLYLVTVRFLAEGHEHWRTDQSLSNAEPKNPYIAGPPIRKADLFFGRNDMLKEVMELLESSSVILLGPRRSGKTSFLYQLADNSRANWTTVMIDLHSFMGSSTSKIISGLWREIYWTCLPDSSHSPPSDIQELRRKIRGAGIKKMLILLDEMAVLTNHPQVALQLRSMSKWQMPETRVVLAGTASDLNKVTSAAMDIGSPPFNEYTRRELEEISRQHAQDLLEKPVLGFYRYEVDALEKLLEIGGGRPFFLNFLGQLVLRFVRAEQGRIIRIDHVESARKEAPYELEHWFQEFIGELDAITRSKLPNLIQNHLELLWTDHAETLRNAGLTIGPRHRLHLCPLLVEWWNLKSKKEGEL